MRTYASSRVKRKSFHRKSELQFVFVDFRRAILVHQNDTPIRRLLTKLCKGAWNVSANNSETVRTVGHKDLRLGQIVYILVFYNISLSFLLLDGFQFIFLLRDSENDLYMVTHSNYSYLHAIRDSISCRRDYSVYYEHLSNMWVSLFFRDRRGAASLS